MKKIRNLIQFTQDSGSPVKVSLQIIYCYLQVPVLIIHELLHIIALGLLGVHWKFVKEETYFLKREGNTLQTFNINISFNTNKIGTKVIAAAPILGYPIWLFLLCSIPFVIPSIFGAGLSYLMLIYIIFNWDLIGMSNGDKLAYKSFNKKDVV